MRSSNERDLQLPSGFRFHPTDEELVMDYLCRKCASQRIAAPVIAEVDLYKFDPWQLPDLAVYGEKEWYFFSPRDRKYPNGSRPNRSAANGYWKATGADKPIGRLTTVAIKKALVFYAGKHTKGIKTNWIMHEYRLANVDRSAKGHLRLDEWVLCRIYNKKGIMEKYDVDDQKKSYEREEQKPIMPPPPMPHHQQQKQLATAGGLGSDLVSFDLSDEPTLHTEESSGGSECVTTSPGLSYNNNKEVQSEAKPIWDDLDLDTNFMDGIPLVDDEESMFQFQMEQLTPLQGKFFSHQTPF